MKTPAPFVTIVSGSPRDGTAMMMRMLMSGGLEVLLDASHKAGEPEPYGYYDYEPSLMLDVDSTTSHWVASALGKSVKVMPYQLQYLSPAFEYRVVFVCRAVADVLESWTAMGLAPADSTSRENEGGKDTEAGYASFEAALLRHERMPTMFVQYRDLTADPATQAVRVVEFLGLPLDVDAMSVAAHEA